MRTNLGNPRHPTARSSGSSLLAAALLAVTALACSGSDPVPPTLTSTSPAGAATGVSTNSKIIANFDQPMRPLSAASFTVVQGGTPVSGSVATSADGMSATFSPAAALAASSVFTATIATSATAVSGAALAAARSWTFTTGLAPDTTPPTVTAQGPVAGATGVALNSKVTATFSKPIDPTTITAASFTLKQGTTAVAGAVALGAGNVAMFTPAAALAGSTVYTATITTAVADLAGNALAAAVTWTFTTGAAPDTTPPTVSSTSPASAATGVSVSAVITATFSKSLDPLTITGTTFTLKQGSTAVAGAVTHGPGTLATFTPTAALASNTVYTAAFTTGIKDLAGNALAAAYSWSFTTAAAVDTTPPTVVSTLPASNATSVAINSTVTATFSKPLNAASVTAASAFTLNQGATAIAGVGTYAASVATFTPNAALAASTVYIATLSVMVTDVAGNHLAAAYVWSFTTGTAADTTPPTVVSTVPANSATGVALNAAVTATFSKAINAASVTAASAFTLNQGATAVAGVGTYAASVATFTPTAALAASTVYTATLSVMVTDVAGNHLATAYVWSFTTGTAFDTTPPTVTAVFPLMNATGTSIGVAPTATFSKPMAVSSITAAHFTLSNGTSTVAGSVTYGGSNTATFTPTNTLAAGTTYMATITTGVTDLAGNALAAADAWSFTTASSTPRGPAAVFLGTAGNYVILAKSQITTVPTSAITGDIALSPAAESFIIGFGLTDHTGYATSPQITGKAYAADQTPPTPSNLTTAVGDMMIAYTDAKGRSGPDHLDLLTGAIGGQTLAPGLYKWNSSVGMSGDVFINGGANDVWIFQMTGDLTMDAAKHVILQGGALAKNIFWQVDGKVAFGAGAHFEGVILCATDVTVGTGGSMNGRILAQTQVTVQAATLVQPAP